MNKKILTLGLTGVLTLSGVARADSLVITDDSSLKIASQLEKAINIGELQIKDRPIKPVAKKEKIIIDVVIPEFSGLTDKRYEDKINTIIKEAAETEIKLFEKGAEENTSRKADEKSELKISYEVKSKGDIVSLVVNRYRIYAREANGENKSTIYNIDIVNNKKLDLRDVFKPGAKYIDVINKEIKSQIAKNPDDYLKGEGGFKTIKESQKFYIDQKGDFVIVFEEYEIAPKSMGVVEFKVPLDKLKDMLVLEAINQVQIMDRELKLETRQDISVIIPEVKGLSNKAYEIGLNNKIETKAKKDAESFEKEIKDKKTTGISEFKVSYDVKSDGNIKSIVVSSYKMISGDSTGSTRRDYYNVDTVNNRTLELQDLFKDGANYRDLINKEIKSQISQNKKKYFDGDKAFNSISKKQGFYLDEIGSIMIEFPMMEIAPRTTGTPVFKISNLILKDILKDEIASKGVHDLTSIKVGKKIVDLKSDMYISEKGNLMIPLGQVVERLGYKLDHNEKLEMTTLNKGNISATVSLKENQYSFSKALVILEEEAKSVNGITYVPREFFEKVLNLETLVDEKGILTIK